MFSAILFTIAVVAMGQFALYYWRAVFTGVASQPVSSSVLEAAHVNETTLSGNDFAKLVKLHGLTPKLAEDGSSLGFVRVYYELVRHAEALFGSLSPMVANWSRKERLLCARYAAAQIEHRLQMNLIQAASARSL